LQPTLVNGLGLETRLPDKLQQAAEAPSGGGSLVDIGGMEATAAGAQAFKSRIEAVEVFDGSGFLHFLIVRRVSRQRQEDTLAEEVVCIDGPA